MISPTSSVLGLLMVVSGLAASVRAQDADAQAVVPPPEARREQAGVGSLPQQSQAENRRPQATLEFYAGHNFETDFSDEVGSMSLSRAGVDFSALFPVTDTGSIGFGLNAEQSWYDFTDFSYATPALGPTPIGGPWDDIRSFAATVSWFNRIDEKWSYFASGQIQSAGEEGANFEDTLTYGGALAFSYQASESLAIGAGIAVTTKLEDDALVIPIPSLRWQISEKWMLTSDLDHDGVGMKLAFDVTEALTLALKGGYMTRDFRLADDNAASEGVGRHSGIPIRVSLDWQFAPQATLWVAGGYVFAQELELNAKNGDEIATFDLDASPMVSAGLSLRF